MSHDLSKITHRPVQSRFTGKAAIVTGGSSGLGETAVVAGSD